MTGYKFFWSGPLSQWHRSTLELDEVEFVTAEQAMMYLKAKLFKDEKIAARILKTPDPGAQKALGRKVSGFNEKVWRKHREEIVYTVSYAKFDQNKGLSARDAANRLPETWPGLNLLGKTLTRVRDELMQKYPDQALAVAKEV